MTKSKKSVSCPVEITLRVIGGRWKVLAMHYLLEETRRFNELHRLLGGIAPRTLAKQLRELERDGVVHREVYPEIPPRVEYSLTPLGRSLEPVLRSMAAWGQSFEDQVSQELTTKERVAPMSSAGFARGRKDRNRLGPGQD